jgi:hypothetical protein
VVHLPVSAWNRLKSELIRWHETFEISPPPSLAHNYHDGLEPHHSTKIELVVSLHLAAGQLLYQAARFVPLRNSYQE